MLVSWPTLEIVLNYNEKSWGLLLGATPGRKRGKLCPICEAEWVSCFSAAMLPYSGIGSQPYLEPILTGSFNPKIHCL